MSVERLAPEPKADAGVPAGPPPLSCVPRAAVVHEPRDAEPDHAEEVVDHRHPVFGGAEVGPVAGEGMAPECTGPRTQPEIEFGAGHRIFQPPALEVQNAHLIGAGLKHRRRGELDRAAVEPPGVVESTRQRLQVAEPGGDPHAESGARQRRDAVALVAECLGCRHHAGAHREPQVHILLAREAGVPPRHQKPGAAPGDVGSSRAGDRLFERRDGTLRPEILTPHLRLEAQPQVPLGRRAERHGRRSADERVPVCQAVARLVGAVEEAKHALVAVLRFESEPAPRGERIERLVQGEAARDARPSDPRRRRSRPTAPANSRGRRKASVTSFGRGSSCSAPPPTMPSRAGCPRPARS